MKVYSNSYAGKYVRLKRIMPDGKSVILALDHGFEYGPSDFPREHLNPRVIVSKVVEAGVDAVMVLSGVARMIYDVVAGKVALIVKLTSKTNLRPEDGRMIQSPIATVRGAIALGADAVAATVYWGSQYEHEMVKQWSVIKGEAESYGLPALQLAYPRGPKIENMYDVEIVRYGVRAAVECGADIIKTYYTGSTETFKMVVEAASGVPVLMSGGPRRDRPIDFLKDVKSVMDAGGRGVVVGRNVFQHRDPTAMARAIVAIVHEGLDVDEAARKFNV